MCRLLCVPAKTETEEPDPFQKTVLLKVAALLLASVIIPTTPAKPMKEKASVILKHK